MPLNITRYPAPQNTPIIIAGHATAHEKNLAGDLLMALFKKVGYNETPLPEGIGNVSLDINNIDLFNEIFVKLYAATRDKQSVQEIIFDHQFPLSLIDCDGGLIIDYGERHFELANITIELLTNFIISDYHDHPVAYNNTLLEDFISMQVTMGGNNSDEIYTHKKIDILYKIHRDIPQPCFIAAAYMMVHENVSPFDFPLPETILKPLKEGEQFDIGLCMCAGNDDKNECQEVEFIIKRHDNGKTSLQVATSPRDLFNHADKIHDFLAGRFGEKCILLTSSGNVGHFVFYDIKHKKIYSGGTKALDEQSSGIELVHYLGKKYARNNEKQQVTLFCSNNSADEVADIIASFG
ncbi:hypothetical protein [Acerihabitans arboris]|uniref:Uncharacterized protein n=1 Tax=Acerihabitans arboris TaxID=2691583 RepID=A0A845SRI7_9GAMM|nr:hypothetical protein [Acerihabitans arboris]NDL65486.1 hypothetical protein [Acerihabitans arboris]